MGAENLLEYARSFVELLGQFESREELEEYFSWAEDLGKNLSQSEKQRILDAYFRKSLK